MMRTAIVSLRHLRKARILPLICAFLGTSANADTMIEAVPTAWRLQDYLDGTIATWYTGSTCFQGALNLPASTSADSKNRYWSMVMTAKVAGKPIGVYYTVQSGVCLITNFYLKEQ